MLSKLPLQKITSLAIITATILLKCTYTYADSVQDYYILQALERYFPLPADAKSIATGASTDLTCQGSICAYLNPAGLGLLDKQEFSLSFSSERVNGNEFITDNSIEQTEQRGYIILATPLGSLDNNIPKYGSIAFGFSRYQGETNDTISSKPDGHRRSIAYGYAVNQDLSLGYTFTFYDDQLNSELADIHSHARILHLFGTQIKLSKQTSLGAAFKLGLGQSDTEDYIKQSNGLSKPREYSGLLGISTSFGNFRPSLAFEYSHLQSEGNLDQASPAVVIGSSEDGEYLTIKSGLEYQITSNLVARAGFRWIEITDYEFDRSNLRELNGKFSGFGYSAGLGYEFVTNENQSSGPRLDYGFDYLGAANGEWEHRISISVPFNAAI